MTAVIVAILGMIALTALLSGFLLLNSNLVFNSPRYMAVNPCFIGDDPRYVQKLPNVLMELYAAGFTSPWPARPTAWSAMIFRRRLSKMFHGTMAGAPRWTQRHLSLWAFIQLHQHELRHFLLQRQMQDARRILYESTDAAVRHRMLGVLNQGNDFQARTAEQELSPRAGARSAWTHDWITRLQRFDVLFREHGYNVSAEFAIVDRLRETDAGSIREELFVRSR